MLVGVETSATRSDPSLSGDVCHLRDDEPCAAQGAAPEVNEVPVIDEAFGRGVLAHRGDDDSILELEPAHLERSEGRRGGDPVAGERCALCQAELFV